MRDLNKLLMKVQKQKITLQTWKNFWRSFYLKFQSDRSAEITDVENSF